MILVNNQKPRYDGAEVANTLDNFFSNITTNLKNANYYVEDNLLYGLFRHLAFKTILKCKNNPSISLQVFIIT